jgi:two-component system sensor histidine kinase YesM
MIWSKLGHYYFKLKALVRSRRLRVQLVLLFVLVSLIPLISLGVFSYYRSSKTIQNITRTYSNDIINEMSTNILLRFKNINDISKVLLNNGTVKDILSKDKAQALSDFNEDNLRMSLLLKTIMDSNPNNIRSVYILPEKNGSIYAIGDIVESHGLAFLNDEYRKNYKESSLYTDTIKAVKNYIWWPTQNVLGNNVFILTEKLYDDTEGVLGVLVIHIGMDTMDSIYRSLESYNNSKMYLIDGKGRILFHPEKANIGKQIGNRQIQDIVTSSDSGSFILRENNGPLFVVYNTFSVTDWKAIVTTNYTELISDAEKIRTATLVITILCLLFIITVTPFIAKSILKPIVRLMQLMKQGSTGDMNVRFNTRYNDEIGQLGDCFNNMMENIGKLIRLVEDESAKKVEAELKVLESHINPHFLYNTLASMYWSAMAKGDTEMGRMASSLSNFFRLGLNKGKEFTTVGKEAEHVKEYLNIQSMLYQNRFDYELEVDTSLYKYRTIKLILQPLAENSLNHGFERKKEKGHIKITILNQDNRIVFKVTDNGCGIDNLDEKGLDSILAEGYGLKNIKDRLRLYFSNDFTISCSSEPGVETTFQITIPALINEEVK